MAALQRRLEGTDGLNHRQLALLRHALRHAGFRYTVLSHQSSHGVSNQTARSDLVSGVFGQAEHPLRPLDLWHRSVAMQDQLWIGDLNTMGLKESPNR